MIINPISYGGSGLLPEIIVTAAAGSTLDLIQNGVVLKTYTLGSTETQHTFVVRNVGKYTVKSTLGDNTYSSNVLIETAGQYPVVITGKLYLYNYGDECEEVTGGWGSKQLWEEYPNGVTSKGSDYLYGADEGNSYGNGQWATKNIINMSAYKKLCAIISAEWYCPSSSYPVHVGIRISKEDFNYQSDWGYSGGTAYTELAISQLTEQTSGSIEKKTFEIDITNIDKGLIWLYNWSGALYTYTMKAKYYAVWLE